MLYDFYNDKDGFLANFLKNASNYIPVIEKTASSNGEVLNKEELTDEAFADKQNRMFPIYTKEAAVLSGLYIVAQNDKVSDFVKTAAQEALNIFGVDFNISKEAEKVSSFAKTASKIELSDNDFIFPAQKKLPVVDEETFEMSKTAFLNNIDELSVGDVIVGARQFIKKASELNISLENEEQNQFSILGVVGNIDNEELEKMAEERFVETADEDYRVIFDRLKNPLTKIASNGGAPLVVSFLTKEAEYFPTSKVFEKIAKVVKNKTGVVVLGDNAYSVDELKNIDESELSNFIPKEDIKIIYNNNNTIDEDKLVTYFHSLNDHEKEMFNTILQKIIKGQ